MSDYNVYLPLKKVIKRKQKRLALTRFIPLVKKYDWMIHENLFISTNQDSTVSFTWENSRTFNITSKYIFNKKAHAS